MADYNHHPTSISGVLRKPIDRVKTLSVEAYPGTNRDSLQVLGARNFLDQPTINIIWSFCMLCLIAAAACTMAFLRQPRGNQPG